MHRVFVATQWANGVQNFGSLSVGHTPRCTSSSVSILSGCKLFPVPYPSSYVLVQELP
ncbi:hypothetical protein M404DRAFT_1001830 [Pisolithus tinctorius Marx 270]|uniref:Uncharacterized protein n=1 Tax=Pisolithus tinctorius Marx 270 TaxID=870435 RepID=A0A0C3JZX4_PISTI|nr:hypothetical protein M404DRAFT_1001830 [Pisolithus tinctorius Marx 270]